MPDSPQNSSSWKAHHCGSTRHPPWQVLTCTSFSHLLQAPFALYAFRSLLPAAHSQTNVLTLGYPSRWPSIPYAQKVALLDNFRYHPSTCHFLLGPSYALTLSPFFPSRTLDSLRTASGLDHTWAGVLSWEGNADESGRTAIPFRTRPTRSPTPATWTTLPMA